MTRMIVSCLLLSMASTATSARAAGKYPPELSGAKVEIYKRVGDVVLKLFIFSPERHGPGDARPAVVFFFGGGWRGGSPKQFEHHCRYLASRGMVAIAADYRVASRHKTSPRECVMDGKSAIRWVRANAARLGIDPERIAAGGGSAGGHVAAATATVDGFEQPGEDTSVSARPNALLLFNPVFDNGPQGFGYKLVKDYWRAFSPIHNIRRGMAPSIVFLGTRDKLIPVATAEAWKGKTEQAGGRCELHLYEGQPHGFFNYGRSGGKYYYETVLAMDKFLVSLGWLKGEPTIKPPAGAK